MYETLHFTAKASVHTTAQGTSQDSGLVRTLGTTLERPPPGLVADPGASSGTGPTHGPGSGRQGTWPGGGRRRLPGTDWAEAVVPRRQAQAQHARAPPALCPELTNPRPSPPGPAAPCPQQMCTGPTLDFSHVNKTGAQLHPQPKLRLAQAGLQRPEGPAPQNQP